MTVRRKLAWKRFWAPLGQAIQGDAHGYLLEPEPDFGRNVGVVTLDALDATRCLILLGDPGMGKSHELEQEVARIRAAGRACVKLDLALHTDEARLLRDTFETKIMSDWQEGAEEITLFLDALDESLVSVRAFGPNLLARLESLPVERLRLRIVCRTADWPHALDEGLDRVFTSEHIGRFELLALRRADSELAAREAGLEVTTFFRALDTTDVHSLATRPLTLDMLVKTAGAQGGQLPASRVALFERAVRRLATEHDELYAKDAFRFDPSHRVAAAMRIAAISVLCGLPRIVLRTEEEIGDEELDLDVLPGLSEQIGAETVEISASLLRETARTALFTGAIIGAVTWSHRALAEYLTATWLVSNGITGERLNPLLFHWGNERRVVPQLRGVASWLASIHRGTLERLATMDPLLLLGADALVLDEDARATTTAGVLARMDALEAHDMGVDFRRHYGKLEHPGLDALLRPYIADRSRNPVVRRVAIDIAEACSLHAVEDILLDLALDPTEHYGTREQATAAIGRIGSPDARRRLRALIAVPEGDPDDSLLACALEGLWRNDMSTTEMFGVLRPRQNLHLFGTYAAFLMRLPSRLDDAEMVVAVAWAAANISTFHDEPIILELTARARGLLARPSIRESYARLLVQALQDNPTRAPDGFAELAVDQRRALLPLVLERSPDDWRLFGVTRLFGAGDVVWLPTLLETPLSATARSHLILLLRDLLGLRLAADDVNAIVTAALRHADLRNLVALHLSAIDIHSETAAEQRRVSAQLAGLSQPAEVARVDPPPGERVQHFIEVSERGDAGAWWLLAREMTLRPDSRAYGDDMRVQTTAEPGWTAADEPTRSRIVDAAQRYLEQCDAAPDQWLGRSIIHRPAIGGYRAMRLLLEVAPARLAALPAAAWQAWAPAAVGLRTVVNGRDARESELVQLAYASAPTETIATVLRVLDAEDRAHGQIFIGEVFDEVADVGLDLALLDCLRGRRMRPRSAAAILTYLLRRNTPGALDIAQRMLGVNCVLGGVAFSRIWRRPLTRPRARWRRMRSAVTKGCRERAALFCGALLEGQPQGAWLRVWQRVRGDDGFGRETIERIAARADLGSNAWISAMSESQVADLHLWLRRLFPPQHDIDVGRAHFVTDRESAVMLRSRLLNHLGERRTFASRDALRRIAAATGDRTALVLATDAEALALADAWKPPTAADLLQLARRPETRLVDSEGHLLDVIIDSLGRVGAKLQGELPRVQFLWNDQPGGSLRPKSEEALSDFVAGELGEELIARGVVVNREVQIRPRRGDRPGERTDIHVDVVVAEPQRRLRVIIEVKGNWNPELETGLDLQLADRYLVDNDCQHGIYLVGWFASDRWDMTDHRRGAANRRDRIATLDALRLRTAAQTTGGRRLSLVTLDLRM